MIVLGRDVTKGQNHSRGTGRAAASDLYTIHLVWDSLAAAADGPAQLSTTRLSASVSEVDA